MLGTTMRVDLRIPKRQVRVEVALAGMSPIQIHLFQAEHPLQHSGFERPSDLLNSGLSFMPAVGLDGLPRILHRDAVLRMSVIRSAELGSDDPPDEAPETPEIVRIDLTVGFDTGVSISGRLIFAQPENRRRLVDYLNDCPQFFCLRDDDRVHIVNKSRIACVATRV
jgi:hypothetical protein